MNARHLELCASDGWAGIVKSHIIPWILEDVELGDDIIEVGPGPGRTTEIFRELAANVTAVELDEDLAAKLATRFAGTNVEVLNADATAIPCDSNRFSAALSLTMLHHVPEAALQDKIFAELARVLRPGGTLAGVDSLDSERFRDLHEDDICVPIDPSTLPARLAAAGFVGIRVDKSTSRVRFRATKPH
jgi:ubiquinone/menaquinone biosynthesis C-methylase UbiE